MEIYNENNIKATNLNINSELKLRNAELIKAALQNIAAPAEATEACNLSMNREIKNAGLFADILKMAGFKTTTENMKLVQALISEGFPVTSENLSSLNQASRLMDNDVDKGMFFLKNNILVSVKNSEVLKNYIKGEIQLTEQIGKLTELIDEIGDDVLKNKLINKLLENVPADKIPRQNAAVNGNQSSEQGQPLKNQDAAKELFKTDSAVPKNIEKAEIKAMNRNDAVVDISAENAKNANTAVVKEADAAAKTLPEIINTEITDKNNLLRAENMAEKGVTAPEYQKSPDSTANKEAAEIIKGANIKTSDEALKTDIPLKDKVMQKFILKADNADPKEIDKVLNELKNNIRLVKEELPANNPSAQKITEAAENINKNINFLNELKNSAYIQMPVNINDKPVNTELFVFNNKREKKPKDSPEMQSVLIALDLLSLGRLETYIQKNGDNVSCQFRVQNDTIADIIKSNINLLNDKLKQINIQLINCAYKKAAEPFNLTDGEPMPDKDLKDINEKDYIFDSKA